MRTFNFGLLAIFNYIVTTGAIPSAPAKALAYRQLPNLCDLPGGSEICAICGGSPSCSQVTELCNVLCSVDGFYTLPFCQIIERQCHPCLCGNNNCTSTSK
ncbi:hypothetical protein BGY98DRAFT_997748 [Russula aff. rugulosa BPL654]|nr:hypothetical protein BGY98DRAFT_997748 [Russula aff. rugulosa BPL654]